jgi:hypothetical protein
MVKQKILIDGDAGYELHLPGVATALVRIGGRHPAPRRLWKSEVFEFPTSSFRY